MIEKGAPWALHADAAPAPAGPGVTRRVLAYTDGLMCVENTFETGAVGALHSHPHTQITYVVRGVFEFTISSEKFLEGNNLFSDLKLRLSYGTNGNLPTDYYGYMGTYATTGGYGSEPGIYWSNISNPSLGWEKSHNFNVGLDWTLFNRVTLTFDYYNKLTKDLLFLSPTSYVTGFSSYWNNIGELKNQGLVGISRLISYIREYVFMIHSSVRNWTVHWLYVLTSRLIY